jgi:hypothetical protein
MYGEFWEGCGVTIIKEVKMGKVVKISNRIVLQLENYSNPF